MATVGVFDSGAGGLSVLKELLRQLPGHRFVYYADNANVPYGEKSAAFITGRSREITRTLIGKGADIIVVACNTATAAAIDTLRASFPLPFVGMEPAVKPAALGTRSGVIGVLATAGTFKGSRYLTTRSNYEDGCKIVESVGKGWVELVENGILDGPKAEDTVRASVQPLLDSGADTLVLGCTHYPFLTPVIARVAGPGVKLINPAPAVARRTAQVLSEKGLLPIGTENNGDSRVELLSSGDGKVLHKLYGLVR